MEYIYLLVIFLLFAAFILSVENACKIEIFKKRSSDEGDKNDSVGVISFIKSLTPLGLGVSASCLASYIYSAVNGAFGTAKVPDADAMISTIIFAVSEIVSFIILFYIVYGVLSMFKSHGGDEKARRKVAGWTTVIVSFAVIFLASQLGVNDVNSISNQETPQSQVTESFEGSREDVEKFGRLIVCGYWEGTNGTDLNISIDKIVEVNPKTYEEGESYRYSIRSIDQNSDGTFTAKAEFSQGGTSFYADFIFKDLDNMRLKNYATNETSTYQARTKPYPQHLDNNLQYIFLYGRMGNGFYMDLETLQVLEDQTGWSFNVISANMDKGGQRGDVIPMNFSISIYDGTPFVVDNNREIPVDINDTSGANALRRNAFLTSYYYAFGRNYGSRF